ncbi:alpha-1,2-mannosyltransferase ALG9 [Caerostris extrusa]|uniref:Alpha-1,2-mannosyltransferase ALG9 n=1 Tax=Caerostris extrusa TaxID=172846 RepID=A0AAV4RVW7_CAEEX|nr:alpha-1,2-mannosyltransferase ALG9 [Caerostris extrusa]
MNDQNLEEPSRYVDIKNCDYIVDSDYPNHSSLEPRYSRNPKWNKIFSLSFLDGQRSHPLLRAFYIPYFTDYFCKYVDYNLLQSATINERLIRRKKKVMLKKA